MGLWQAFQSGASGLRVSQAGLATVGHNIANADSEGYSRQRITISPLDPLGLGGGNQLGRGAQLQSIRRVHDAFLELQVLGDRTRQGFHQSRAGVLSSIERLYTERSDPTVGGALDGFFNAARELSQDANNLGIRRAFIGSAQAVVDGFRTLDRDLRTAQRGIDDTLLDRLDRVNQLASSIAELNARVVATEVGGGGANDLRDRRDQAIRELSDLVSVNVLPQKDGTVALEVAGSFALVQGDVAARLQGVPDAGNQGLHRVVLSGFSNLQIDLTARLTQGEIGGLLNVRDQVIGTDLAELDQLAFTFVNEVNAAHQAGFGLDGVNGRVLFQPLGGAQFAAANLALDPVVAADPNLVAAATAAGGLPGDNRNALALAALQDVAHAALGGVSFNRRFAEVLHDVGRTAAENQQRLEVQRTKTQQSEALRESVEGVSIDDEMIDLTRFQKHFEANSRVITAVDRMLDSVLQLLQ